MLFASSTDCGIYEAKLYAAHQQSLRQIGRACRYMEATLEHKRLQCKELVATDRLSCVKTLTRLFDALATPENGVLPDDAEHYPAMIELWFQFALIWGIGGSLAEEGRKK